MLYIFLWRSLPRVWLCGSEGMPLNSIKLSLGVDQDLRNGSLEHDIKYGERASGVRLKLLLRPCSGYPGFPGRV